MMGAVLAAGQTGSGKSTFTETTLLLSLLCKYNPDELKLLLIDPKVVQFTQYQGIPHLLRPVITEPDAAREAFDWVLSELQRRTESPDENHPYIVIVIDEVSDLMAIDKQFYEHAFSTIANSADKTGIHLYMGTSRPSTDIYTDKLRESIGGRIIFTTASEIDSITMLERAGSEQLAGYGEMLFKPYHGSETIKIQTPYASDEDTMRVTDFWRNQGKI
ncbi:DNA translocase FtsK [Candidatus Saccharibacteria bacterium]|nr:DNA translocase FtsK [Candidatus Saccharibacteria bacterium]